MINKPENPLLSVKGECPKVLVVQNSFKTNDYDYKLHQQHNYGRLPK